MTSTAVAGFTVKWNLLTDVIVSVAIAVVIMKAGGGFVALYVVSSCGFRTVGGVTGPAFVHFKVIRVIMSR